MCSGLAAARDRQNLNFTQLMPDVLLKERPSFARLFTKMNLSEDLGTLNFTSLLINIACTLRTLLC